LLISLFVTVSAATAGNVYDFEMVLFERPGGGGNEFWPADPGTPDRAAAIGSLNDRAVAGKALGPMAYTLKKKGMIILDQLAWRQTTRGLDSDSWYWISGQRLSGLIRISRGRYLHLDTDLVLLDRNSSRPYRIKLHRRMRSDELHYVDHPKLGILIRARPQRSAAPSNDAGGASSGEPKPAAPLATSQPG